MVLIYIRKQNVSISTNRNVPQGLKTKMVAEKKHPYEFKVLNDLHFVRLFQQRLQ